MTNAVGCMTVQERNTTAGKEWGDLSIVNMFSAVQAHKGWLPRSKIPATGPYPVSSQSIPCPSFQDKVKKKKK
jgi:hypothetical protein